MPLNTNNLTHKAPLHTNVFTHRRFYTHRRFGTQNSSRTDTLTRKTLYIQTLLHTEALYTHRHFYTGELIKLIHIETFTRKTSTHRHIYARMLWHTHTHKRSYTQTPLHIDISFPRRFFSRQILLHMDPFQQKTLWHTDAFTRRHFCTQVLLHTDAFTHRHFDTQKLFTRTLLHIEASTHRARTHRCFYT